MNHLDEINKYRRILDIFEKDQNYLNTLSGTIVNENNSILTYRRFPLDVVRLNDSIYLKYLFDIRDFAYATGYKIEDSSTEQWYIKIEDSPNSKDLFIIPVEKIKGQYVNVKLSLKPLEDIAQLSDFQVSLVPFKIK